MLYLHVRMLVLSIPVALQWFTTYSATRNGIWKMRLVTHPRPALQTVTHFSVEVSQINAQLIYHTYFERCIFTIFTPLFTLNSIYDSVTNFRKVSVYLHRYTYSMYVYIHKCAHTYFYCWKSFNFCCAFCSNLLLFVI